MVILHLSKRNVKYVKSIANYNAIYKKEIISRFRYDDQLIMSDDNELNFRFRKAGYHFINVPDARVWHHETSSITEFARNMFRYGVNITNTVKKHRSMVTINVPLTMIFILYLILTVTPYTTSWGPWYLFHFYSTPFLLWQFSLK